MKLFWSPRSPFVRKVMVVAYELGVAEKITIIPTVVKMGEPNLDLLPHNPLSKIPTLVLDDGRIIFDSLTICDYLNHQFKGNLIPKDYAHLTTHALANSFLDLLVLWRNERDKPQEQQSPEWMSSFNAKTTLTLDYFEKEITQLRNETLDIRHITLAIALSYLDFRFASLEWRNNHPLLTTWHEEFAKRSSMLKTEASV